MNILSAQAPAFNQYGGIDLVVNAEGIGVIPFTATPDDGEQHGRELYDRAMAGEFGPVAEYIAPKITEQSAIAAIQSKLDAEARASGYDSILSACSYLGSISPQFAADAERFSRWRDEVWTFAVGLLERIKSGETSMPATLAELTAMLPVLPGRS